MILIDLPFIWFWWISAQPARESIDWFYTRALVVLGYGWLAAMAGTPTTGPGVIAKIMVEVYIISLGIAVWNNDDRLFRPKKFATHS